jgi:hypothetical protein
MKEYRIDAPSLSVQMFYFWNYWKYFDENWYWGLHWSRYSENLIFIRVGAVYSSWGGT